WFTYEKSVSEAERVATIAGWLEEPDATRPRFATLYFEGVDTAAHDHGPDSPEARAALVAIDTAIGTLLDRLDSSGRLATTNIIVVSDHGMAPVPPGQQVSVSDWVTMDQARITSIGQVVQVQPNAGFEAQVEARLLGRHDHFECW